MEVGRFVKLAVNHEVVQMLTDDSKDSCVDVYEEHVEYDHCIYSRLRDLMLKDVGCTVPWLPDKSNICKDYKESKKAFEIYQQNRRNQQDICPNSCLFTNMYFGPPVTGIRSPDFANVGWGVFYFRRDIKMTREYYLYSLLSMAAEIGGYVGLLLGASLVNVGYINNFLLDFCLDKDKSKGLNDSNKLPQTGKSMPTEVAVISNEHKRWI